MYYGNGDQSKTLSLEQDGFWQKNSKSEALKFLNDSLFTVYGGVGRKMNLMTLQH